MGPSEPTGEGVSEKEIDGGTVFDGGLSEGEGHGGLVHLDNGILNLSGFHLGNRFNDGCDGDLGFGCDGDLGFGCDVLLYDRFGT